MALFCKDLSPCVVDYSGATVVFSKTFGGVIFRYQEEKVKIFRDQAGVTAVDQVAKGAPVCELEMPVSEETLANLDYFFGNSSQSGTSLEISNPVGGADFAGAVALIVKPIVNGVVSVTEAEWLVIHRAAPTVNMELKFDNDGQRVVKVLFQAFPDDTSGLVGHLFRAGPAI